MAKTKKATKEIVLNTTIPTQKISALSKRILDKAAEASIKK